MGRGSGGATALARTRSKKHMHEQQHSSEVHREMTFDEMEEMDEEEEHEQRRKLGPWFWGLAKYTCFISIFTIINVALRPTEDMYQYNALWESSIGQSLTNVVFVDQLWKLLNGPILDLVSDDYFTRIGAYWPGDTNAYIYGNRRLGNIRLRQVRVQGEECPVTQNLFAIQDNTLSPFCFPQYSLLLDEGFRSNTSYHRSQQVEPLKYLSCEEQGCKHDNGSIVCCTDLPVFQYRGYEELNESSVPFWAAVNSYHGGGYVVDLLDAAQAASILHDLQFNYDWIDLKTRALFIDYSFYNANLDLFVVARLALEFLPSGRIITSSTFRTIQLNRYTLETYQGTALIGLQATLLFFIVVYTFDGFRKFWSDLRATRFRLWKAIKLHFGNFWNTFEFLILFVFYVMIGLTAMNEQEATTLIANVRSIDSSSLQTLGFWATQERNIVGVLALVVWMKIFRYITITQRLERLFKSLAKAVPDLLTYAFLFGLWILAFSFSGILIFGNEIEEFRNVAASISYCLRVLFGDFDVDSLYTSNRVLGPLWLWLFCWSAVIILLNFFVAILCEVYAEVMEESEGNTEKSIMDSIIDQAIKLLGLRRQGKKVAALEQRFNALEMEGEGRVSKVQLQEFLSAEGAFDVFDTSEASEVMRRFDKSGNGYLDPDEMREVRKVIREKKALIERQIAEAEDEEEGNQDVDVAAKKFQLHRGGSAFLSRRQRGGGGSNPGGGGGGGVAAGALKEELRDIKDSLKDVTKGVERSQAVEKKLSQTLELLVGKVDLLTKREEDFKYLRNGLVGDYLKS